MFSICRRRALTVWYADPTHKARLRNCVLHWSSARHCIGKCDRVGECEREIQRAHGEESLESNPGKRGGSEGRAYRMPWLISKRRVMISYAPKANIRELSSAKTGTWYGTRALWSCHHRFGEGILNVARTRHFVPVDSCYRHAKVLE